MRGETERQATLLLGLTPEGFVPRDDPLRRINPLVDSALRRMSPLFDQVYAAGGRPAIPPEHLLKASLLMAFYTIRSERQFCERLLEADPCSSQGQAAARVLLKEVVREARRRETHVSTTGPEARLCYLGHVLTENRHGLGPVHIDSAIPIEAPINSPAPPCRGSCRRLRGSRLPWSNRNASFLPLHPPM